MTNLEKQLAAIKAAVEKREEELDRLRAQLVHQEKLASLGELTAGIAHEIKNPLNFVNNFADVNVELLAELRSALDSGDDVQHIIEDLTKNAQRISEHGRRASELVRSVMQHASKGRGARRRVDLNGLVSEHLALSFKSRQAHMPDLDVKIEQEYSKRVGKVDVVARDIGWVILNLVNNAMDALQEFAAKQNAGFQPVVRVSTERHDDHVEIHVSDNGPGIPPKLQEKVFEPFFTTKPAGTSSGLGLSLSHEIVVKGHDGTLTVESKAGEGTTFVVRLPI